MEAYETQIPVVPLAEHLAGMNAGTAAITPIATLQTELPLNAVPVKELAKVLRIRRDVPVLEEVLADAARAGMPWLSATQVIAAVATFHSAEWTERRVRDAASESRAVASGPGSPGYALAEHATPDQLMHIANALKSQAERMFERGMRLRTAAMLRMKAAGITAVAEVHHEGTKGTNGDKTTEAAH